jgi:hypothetical protein
MDAHTLATLADIGALLVALGLFLIVLVRPAQPGKPIVTLAWIMVGVCAFVALVFAVIVLISLLAG